MSAEPRPENPFNHIVDMMANPENIILCQGVSDGRSGVSGVVRREQTIVPKSAQN